MQTVTLTTDFGHDSHYTAILKAVVMKEAPSANLFDISHEVPDYSVPAGAYTLRKTSKYFPEGTIHLAVVDPGVGGDRAPLAIKTKNFYFVGPDNGLLIPAAEQDGIEEVYRLQTSQLSQNPSSTFHGRDIFGPAAGRLATGEPIKNFAYQVSTFQPIDLSNFAFADKYGNIRFLRTKSGQ